MKTRDWFAASSALVEGSTPRIGAGTWIWHHAHIMEGAEIGEDCNIGQNVFVGRGVRIGRGCKLQNNVNVYEGVTLGDYVFCGPSMTFTNLSTPLPRAAITRHDQLQETWVEEGVSFGAGSVVVCGHRIGQYAFVAAGTVVIRDVAPFELVAGNPARHIGFVCACGERLQVDDAGAICTGSTIPSQSGCGRQYHRTAVGGLWLDEEHGDRG